MTKIYSSIAKTVHSNGRFNFNIFKETFLATCLDLDQNNTVDEQDYDA